MRKKLKGCVRRKRNGRRRKMGEVGIETVLGMGPIQATGKMAIMMRIMKIIIHRTTTKMILTMLIIQT